MNLMARRPSVIKQLAPRLPALGFIKIGRAGAERTSQSGGKYRLPEKLDHFEVVQRVRGMDGRYLLDAAAHAKVGEAPTSLDVFLMYDSPAANLSSRYLCFQGQTRFCSGDGEIAQRIGPDNLYQERACPCVFLESPAGAEENKGKAESKWLKCKPHGKLIVRLACMEESLSCYLFSTSSLESVENLWTVQHQILMATGGVLAGVPLRLKIYPVTTATPGGTATVYKVTLDLPDGGWATVQRFAAEQRETRKVSRVDLKALEVSHQEEIARILADPDAAQEIAAEFYPEQDSLNGLPTEPPEPPGEAAPEPTQPDQSAEAPDPPAPEPPATSKPPKGNGTDPDVTAYRAATDDAGRKAALERLATRKGFDLQKMTTNFEKMGERARESFVAFLAAKPESK